MSELLATAERSQTIRVPADRLWPLLSGPQAWSVWPDLFAFDVTLPPGTRLRLVLGVNGTRPAVGTYELEDEEPGLAMSMRARARIGSERVIRVSAVPDLDSTVATISIHERGRRPGPESGRWLARWLADLRAVAEGHAPNPGPGMPENLRVRCTPDAPLRKPVTVSASALIAAPPSAVWDVIYAPGSSANAQTVAVGVVPGTPSGRAGEMQYFVEKGSDGLFTANVIAVTELDPGRRARMAMVTFPHSEACQLITAHAHGTRLVLTFRWSGNIPGGKSKAYARALTETVQHHVNRYKDLIENRGTQQP